MKRDNSYLIRDCINSSMHCFGCLLLNIHRRATQLFVFVIFICYSFLSFAICYLLLLLLFDQRLQQLSTALFAYH